MRTGDGRRNVGVSVMMMMLAVVTVCVCVCVRRRPANSERSVADGSIAAPPTGRQTPTRGTLTLWSHRCLENRTYREREKKRTECPRMLFLGNLEGPG